MTLHGLFSYRNIDTCMEALFVSNDSLDAAAERLVVSSEDFLEKSNDEKKKTYGDATKDRYVQNDNERG